MKQLGLPTSTINKIVDDPTLLGNRLNGESYDNSPDELQSLGISTQAADHILRGYNDGFRAVFILNATMAAVATIVSVLMIRHKELTREDEAQLKAEAKKEDHKHSDIEMAELGVDPDSSPDSDRKQ